jgi:hypothetical protein
MAKAIAKPATQVAQPTITPPPKQSLVRSFAAKMGVEPDKLMQTLKDTAFKQQGRGDSPAKEVTDSQMMALLVVSNEYGLNPFLKEIYAFPAKGGGIVPIVSIDGWIRMINSRPELKSIEFDYAPAGTEKMDYWVSCTIERHDRSKPITIVEYFSECYRDTEAWNVTGRRMNRHRALIQCARVAFGYGGIHDPDEAERVANAMAIDGTATEVRGKPFTQEPRARIAAPEPAQGALIEESVANAGEIRKLLEVNGIAESELFEHLKVSGFDEMTPAHDRAALEWLRPVQP